MRDNSSSRQTRTSIVTPGTSFANGNKRDPLSLSLSSTTIIITQHDDDNNNNATTQGSRSGVGVKTAPERIGRDRALSVAIGSPPCLPWLAERGVAGERDGASVRETAAVNPASWLVAAWESRPFELTVAGSRHRVFKSSASRHSESRWERELYTRIYIYI